MQFFGKNIILYPTDTVYGLGVLATDPEAVSRLKELKGRDEGKPISIVVSDVAMMEEYAIVTPLARKLAEKFLPGKLTLVLQAKNLPEEITAGTHTVGVRIPNHPIPIQLVKELGKPITATSANVSGMPTETTVANILAQFGSKSTMIYHSENIPRSLPPSEPSTVVDARGDTPVILRQGGISRGDIESV